MPPFTEFRLGLTTLLAYAYLVILLAAPTFLRGYDLLLPVYDGTPPNDAYTDKINAHLIAQQASKEPDRQNELVMAVEGVSVISTAELDKLKGNPPADWPQGKDWPLDLGTALTESSDPVLNRERAAYVSRLLEARVFDAVDKLNPTDAYIDLYGGDAPYSRKTQYYLAKERRVARLSTVAADLCAAKGDWAGATEHLERVLKLADIEARRSTLISRIVSGAMRQLAANTLTQILSNRRPDAAAYRTLAAALDRHAEVGSPLRVLQLERLSALNATASCFTLAGRFSAPRFDRLVSIGRDVPSDAANLNAAGSFKEKNLVLLRALTLRFGASREEALRILNREFDLLENAMTKANSRESVRNWDLDLMRYATPFQPSAMFTGVLCPTLSSFYTKDIDYQTSYDAARLTLAALTFAAETGRSPASAAELAPKYIAGLPPSVKSGCLILRSTTDQTGFVVYSLGRDLTDNDGKHDPEAGNDFRVKRGYDLVYFRSTPTQPPVNKDP